MAEKTEYRAAYEGEPVPLDKRYFPEFEMPGDYVQINSSVDRKDIGNQMIDPSVHAFANDLVDHHNGNRPENPPAQNPHYEPLAL